MLGANHTFTDPLNRSIQIADNLCMEGEQPISGTELEALYRRVIETPACMIETRDGQLVYFRSMGWDFTVLIEVSRVEEKWVATRCLKNPAAHHISELLKDGIFTAGRSLNQTL